MCINARSRLSPAAQTMPLKKVSTLRQKQKYERIGRHAETVAALYLRLRGYRILARRYKTKAGEIDIIARKAKLIVIVEVKQRLTLEAAHESISAQSTRRIADAAEHFISRHRRYQSYGLRFDALFFIGAKPRLRRAVHIQDAF